MKIRYPIFIAFLLLFGGVALGWDASDSPVGHCESAVSNADGKVYLSSVTSITSIMGTAHKGGADQAAANLKVTSYALYRWWDRDRDGTSDAGDEPLGSTTLDGGINNAVTTITVASTATFRTPSTGRSEFFKIDSEVIQYTGLTGTTFTGCTRGINESDPASHLTAAAATAVNVWELALSATTNGSPYNTLGWDATGLGLDDGTEGNLLQQVGDALPVAEGCSYLFKIRVIDPLGNTNTEVGGVDTFASYGTASYCDADGDVLQGLEDPEVWLCRINQVPRRRPR